MVGSCGQSETTPLLSIIILIQLSITNIAKPFATIIEYNSYFSTTLKQIESYAKVMATMIINVIITNRTDAQDVVNRCRAKGPTCWITICNERSHPLVPGSDNHTLVCKFQDVPSNPLTANQSRKIKSFIGNHHKNIPREFTLVVNCHAGISRSAAVGMFCKHNLKIPVEFGPETFPNRGVMEALGVNPIFWATQTNDALANWIEEQAVWELTQNNGKE